MKEIRQYLMMCLIIWETIVNGPVLKEENALQ